MATFHGLRACWIESTAVVPDAQLHLFKLELEGDFNSRRVRVFHGIGDRFFADAEQIVLKHALKLPLGAPDGEAQLYSRVLQCPLTCFHQRFRKSPPALPRR